MTTLEDTRYTKKVRDDDQKQDGYIQSMRKTEVSLVERLIPFDVTGHPGPGPGAARFR